VGNRKILIVDDDSDVRRAMHVRLTANHYDTLPAADALSGMAEALRHVPDLIVLDLGLPARDGFVVMERLKTIPSLAVIPIIVVSALDARENQERAIKAGATAFLQKPVDNVELLAVIRQALEQPVQPEQPAVHDLGSLRFPRELKG
jgi:DNA-binding response OmpR family regulator